MMKQRAIEIGALGIAWMAAWGAFGAGLSIVAGIVDPGTLDPGEGPVDLARIFGGVGGGTGIVFGLLLAISGVGTYGVAIVGGIGVGSTATEAATVYAVETYVTPLVPYGIFEVGLPGRSFVVTLPERDFELTLPERGFVMSLPERDFETALPARTFEIIVNER